MSKSAGSVAFVIDPTIKHWISTRHTHSILANNYFLWQPLQTANQGIKILEWAKIHLQ